MEIEVEDIGNNERTIEDITEVLQLAKMTENDVFPVAQTLYFMENDLDGHNYKLLELDQHLEQNILENQTLYIKGDDEDYAVLCTDNKTYDVVETETSNSVLLVDGLKFLEDVKSHSDRLINKVTVQAIFHNYLEAVPSKPNLKKLNMLLEKSLYKGPEYEVDIDKSSLYSYEDLLKMDSIQASRCEIEQALKDMDIVLMDGKVRLLEFDYHFRVLSYMLKLIEENSWNLDEINYETTLNSLTDLAPKEVIQALFDKYAEESKTFDFEQLYRYNETKVCRFFAKVLLQTAGRFSLADFQQAWRDSVPEGMVTSAEMLHGIALVDWNSSPTSIKYYPEENLPDDITERFKVLFEAKEKWSVPEIAPYIQKLATEKLNVNALLAKHARASTVNGVKHYSAKHGK